MLIEKVKSTIEKYNMLKRHDRVLVGLSGGPDSTVLLHSLCALRKDYFLHIYVAHIDHKVRGEESTSDRRFCEGLAKKLGLEIFCEEADVPKIAEEKGISLEEAARLERYRFFKKVAAAKDIEKLALGHTKDDQAETVLMRVIRGSGTMGLGAMSPVKKIQGITVIRPLIELSRREIEDFIGENNLKFRHDSTNDETVFTRNRIRHELIPYLEANFNSNIKEVLFNMAENIREENDFLERFSKRKLKGISKKHTPSEIVLDIKKFKKQPAAVQKRILRSTLEILKGNLRRFTYQHWKEVEALIDKRPGNSIVDLPGGINIIKNKSGLIVQRGVDF